MFLKIVWVIIFILLLTGGYRTQRFEISEVNVFGWLVLLLGLKQWITEVSQRRWGRLKHADFFPKSWKDPINTFLNVVARYPVPTLCIAIFTYIFIFSWALAWRYQSFSANAFDLGFIDQSVWAQAYLQGVSTAGVRFLHSSLARAPTYLSEHFSPILYFFVPFYKLWGHVYWLFIWQTLFLASGVIFIYLLSRHFKHSKKASLLLAFGYLLYQPLRSANLFDFREDSFFIPIFFGMIFTLEKRRWVIFWFLATLSFLVKENAAIVVFLFGIWLVFRKQWVQGSILALLSIVVFCLINFKLTPYFSEGSSKTVMASRLSIIGGTPVEIIRNILYLPFITIQNLVQDKLSWKTILYIYKVLFPFLPFVLFQPLPVFLPFLFALILLGVNILITPQNVGFHYELILIPFLFVALIQGMKACSETFGKTNSIALFSALLFCVFGRSPVLAVREFHPTKDHRCLSKVLKYIPQSASVAAQAALHPHIDHRRDAHIFLYANNVKDELIAVSFLKNLNRYGNYTLEEEVQKILNYEPLFKSRVFSLWCRTDVCNKYANLSTKLNAQRCLKE